MDDRSSQSHKFRMKSVEFRWVQMDQASCELGTGKLLFEFAAPKKLWATWIDGSVDDKQPKWCRMRCWRIWHQPCNVAKTTYPLADASVISVFRMWIISTCIRHPKVQTPWSKSAMNTWRPIALSAANVWSSDVRLVGVPDLYLACLA